MSIYSNTLDGIVESVCRIVDDWTEGTTTDGGSSTTLIDTNNLLEDDDFYNNLGAWVYIRSGAYAGTYRKVTDFANATSTLTFSPAAGGTIASGVSYSLHYKWKRPDVVDKINLSIDMVAEEAYIWKTDETSITLAASTYEYDLPTDFMHIHKLTMADADGNFYDAPIPPDQYIVIHGTTPKVKFLGMPPEATLSGVYYGALWAKGTGEYDLTADRKLRIEGIGSPDRLSSDSDTAPISPAYLVFQTAALLHASKIQRGENDPDEHATQYKIWQSRADIERARVVAAKLPANAKRVRE